MSLLVKAASLGHYVDQPAIIRKAQKPAVVTAALAGLALLANDVRKAQPGEERRKVAIRDVLVLGATGIGTLAAYKLIMKKEIPLLLPELKELAKRGYDDAFMKLAGKEVKTRKEVETLMNGIRAKAKDLFKDDADKIKKMVKQDSERMFPREPEGGIIDDLKEEIAPFAVVGLASCLSGFTGGLLANKVNGEWSKEQASKMMKEGVFQFIANIAMCAVGASIGLAAVNKFKINNKLARVGIVGTGLSLGIGGGGAIANFIGSRWINPMINKFGNKAGEAQNQQQPKEKRSIEFWDAILHLDDVPTAMVFAGVEILRPFIPLFFAFSGYRTGIGYRNHHGAKEKAPAFSANPFAKPAPLPALFHNGTVFRSFYDQRQQVRATLR